ncbi:MAG: methyltransferase domain-containing protein [Polyangiaceae bacterium]
MIDWNPGQYEKFRDERSRPFFDLMALVEPRPGMRVVDLGCGTGELTRVLHDTLAARETLGLDASEAMLARAADARTTGLDFVKADIREFVTDAPPGGEAPYDLVFANASLQWVDGAEEILGGLAKRLAPGGQLAFQVPANHGHPSHVIAAEVARTEPFRSALGGYVRAHAVLSTSGYAEAIHGLGFEAQRVRLEVYGHVLAGAEDVVEWTRGTLLTAYQSRMDGATFDAFVDTYRRRVVETLGPARPYFYPFERILVWARRAT